MSFKSARIKAGKKIADVVEHLGVTDGAVYQWENGFSYPTVNRLKQLAEYYGCAVDELLRKDEDNAAQ